jgi:hypothetical protein
MQSYRFRMKNDSVLLKYIGRQKVKMVWFLMGMFAELN